MIIYCMYEVVHNHTCYINIYITENVKIHKEKEQNYKESTIQILDSG